MPKSFTLNLPINNLSFGFVAMNLLLEIYKLGLNPCIFPIGGGVDLSPFADKLSEDFVNWLKTNINKSLSEHNRKNLNLKLWHINSSLESLSEKQYLLTFHELDSATKEEINILKNQEHVFVTNNFTKDNFSLYGAENCSVVPLGLDSIFFNRLSKPAYDDPSIITFGVFAKYEKRKHTDIVIKTLCKLYGNNMKYRVHCQIFNPFLGRNPQEVEQNNKGLWHQLTEGNRYANIISYEYTKTLREYNDLLNSCDVVVDGGLNEGWSFPSATCCALGKHCIASSTMGTAMWANSENSIILKPNGKEPCYDGMFFSPGQPFNQGNIFTFNPSDLEDALRLAEDRVRKNRLNEAGLKLQEQFKWENTTKQILTKMGVI